MEIQTFDGESGDKPFSAVSRDTLKDYTDDLRDLLLFRYRARDSPLPIQHEQFEAAAEYTALVDNPTAATVNAFLNALLKAQTSVGFLWFFRITTVGAAGKLANPEAVRHTCASLLYAARLATFLKVCDVPQAQKAEVIKVVKNM